MGVSVLVVQWALVGLVSFADLVAFVSRIFVCPSKLIIATTDLLVKKH